VLPRSCRLLENRSQLAVVAMPFAISLSAEGSS
jgi:hypothetical protein